MFDDDLPRRTDDLLQQLIRQPLDPLSNDELEERVLILQAEIIRTQNHMQKAAKNKFSAEALFRKNEQ